MHTCSHSRTLAFISGRKKRKKVLTVTNKTNKTDFLSFICGCLLSPHVFCRTSQGAHGIKDCTKYLAQKQYYTLQDMLVVQYILNEGILMRQRHNTSEEYHVDLQAPVEEDELCISCSSSSASTSNSNASG
jgi:hypothetical protein